MLKMAFAAPLNKSKYYITILNALLYYLIILKLHN